MYASKRRRTSLRNASVRGLHHHRPIDGRVPEADLLGSSRTEAQLRMRGALDILRVLDAVHLERVHVRDACALDQPAHEIGIAAAKLGDVRAFQQHQRLEESDFVGDEGHQRLPSYQKPAWLRFLMPPGLRTRIFTHSHSVCQKEKVSVLRADVVTAARTTTKRP